MDRTEKEEQERARDLVRQDVSRRMVGLGMNQSQLAAKAGMSFRTVNRFLNEGSWPLAGGLRAIAVALEWPPDELERRLIQARHRTATTDLASATEHVLLVDLGEGALDGLTDSEIREVQAELAATGVRTVNAIKSRTPMHGFPAALGRTA